MELEHPFGLGANHLRLGLYQKGFNSKLAGLFDQTIPQLGYIPKAAVPRPAAVKKPPPKPQQSASSNGTSGGAVSFDFDDPMAA